LNVFAAFIYSWTVVAFRSRLADMSIIENRPAIVLTRSNQDRLSDPIMAPGAPSLTAEFLR
jgi:hypothetical protein